jgi:hypothetical protein
VEFQPQAPSKIRNNRRRLNPENHDHKRMNIVDRILLSEVTYSNFHHGNLAVVVFRTVSAVAVHCHGMVHSAAFPLCAPHRSHQLFHASMSRPAGFDS